MAPLSSFSKLALVFANLLIPCAIYLFASGFFPYKPFLPGIAAPIATEDGVVSSPFDKVIFMVVDALRSDFVFSELSGFEFTQSLIRSGAALPFTAHASSPTVTMPRVKAITTGSVPSFLDVILNFAETDTTSTLAHQDTWLAQIKANLNGSLVFYGDDTWLKLFPDTFKRSDGTSSFFVADYTEVDNNVTRHVPEELINEDWTAMIIHYLGLDHIGHKTGPRSLHMTPKQREMDLVVEEIYSAIESHPHLQSCLLILCGDHGMNDAGNHGGSSSGETSPALVFMSPRFKGIFAGYQSPTVPSHDFDYYNLVEQSDVVPTLAWLLGFPIPLNNLGVFIPKFLGLWDSDKMKLDILLSNANQIMGIVKETFPTSFLISDEACGNSPSTDVEQLICEWKSVNKLVHAMAITGRGFPETLAAVLVFCRKAQEIMSGTASNYNVQRLQLGIAFGVGSVMLAFASSLNQIQGFRIEGLVLVAVSISYAAMMIASSYVEEEHHFWYWTLEGWLFSLYLKESQHQKRVTLFPGVYSFILLLSSRVVRRWNQTGQKFTGEPSIVTALYGDHTLTFWILFLATYADLCQRLRREVFHWAHHSISIILATGVISFAFLFKLGFTFADAPELFRAVPVLDPLIAPIRDSHLTPLARLIFTSAALSFVIKFFAPRLSSSTTTHHPNHVLITLILVTQSKGPNIPLFLISSIQLFCLSKLFAPENPGTTSVSPITITITTLLLSYASFFSFGGSNAISSIDLSSAYNGVSGYNILAVGILTFVSNWAGPIWWASGTWVLFETSGLRQTTTRRKAEKEEEVAQDPKAETTGGKLEISLQHLSLLTLFTSIALVGVMVACTVLRTHLFIWTVFSPKFLYSMAWCLGQHLVVNIGGSVW